MRSWKGVVRIMSRRYASHPPANPWRPAGWAAAPLRARIDAPTPRRLGSRRRAAPHVRDGPKGGGLANDSADHRDHHWGAGVLAGVLAHRPGYTVKSQLALALLIGLVVALLWPWLFGLYMVRRVRQNRQNEIDQEVQKQLAQQQNNPPPS